LKSAIILLAKCLSLLLFAAAIYISEPWRAIPPEWNPWAPLALDHPMNMVTRWKLNQLRNSPAQCQAVLEADQQGTLDYTALEDYTPVEGCPLTNVVRINNTGVGFNAPFTVTCPLAVAWVMFERQQLQRLAVMHLDSEVSQINHYGSFACRNVYNRSSGRRSQHATASAFDVAGFRLDDGSTVSVLRDWDRVEDPQKAAFLRDVHSEACGFFGTVLGPDYNQPHENHFHFDTSNFGFCR